VDFLFFLLSQFDWAVQQQQQFSFQVADRGRQRGERARAVERRSHWKGAVGRALRRRTSFSVIVWLWRTSHCRGDLTEGLLAGDARGRERARRTTKWNNNCWSLTCHGYLPPVGRIEVVSISRMLQSR